MVYNSDEIQKIIPHRFPFLLVDRIDYINEEKTEIIGTKCITANEMQFVGHFPQKHVMPGVLILEALAQTGCILLLSREKFKDKIAYFAGVNKVRFKKKVIPGDVMNLKVKFINSKANVYIAEVFATVKDVVVCSGEIICSVGD
ncbi:MAG: 3-hydroxyacyl-ACP dehydratase FabZ [Peptoniphilaceae bacterium]|uniref:3-hydroxyacyl-ACP dehydratase FabZ n=1 Tax=Parvimonas sp. TaxID=1944660 RepID=UPI0026001633|nr:3-hydroxyacyl-ACP dehydratase FabZ [Parvimonas sp.]MCI5997179.1 3-hydroxyacyl-ACP dehydratase FabZ [Parvimonas sp.]MDD7764272.1 3-hydroxyacyl-ACP dehydratase FabZ [Peptoniphilaceae bacterium]MDY3051535.1 3-hydroxyacyl-ACP dehydratase FabZ [Parvimonas sp.]